MLKTKSVYSPIERSVDGLRILTTRFRGRGLKKSRYDVWMANLGPGESIFRAVSSDKITWSEFSRRYRAQLFESASTDGKNKTIKNHGQKFTLRLIRLLAKKGNVTLLCHCPEEEEHCHRHLLRAMILSRKV